MMCLLLWSSAELKYARLVFIWFLLLLDSTFTGTSPKFKCKTHLCWRRVWIMPIWCEISVEFIFGLFAMNRFVNEQMKYGIRGNMSSVWFCTYDYILFLFWIPYSIAAAFLEVWNEIGLIKSGQWLLIVNLEWIVYLKSPANLLINLLILSWGICKGKLDFPISGYCFSLFFFRELLQFLANFSYGTMYLYESVFFIW